MYDLNGDGSMEIVAGRHSVLYVWDALGNMIWRAPVGEHSSSSNDHGSSRQYAAPVVGDLDGDGDGEIAIAYSNKVAVPGSGAIGIGGSGGSSGSQQSSHPSPGQVG